GTVTLINLTLTGNTAQGGGANTFFAGGSGLGGAVFNLNGTLTVTNSTLAANTVTAASGQSGTGTADGGAIYTLAHPPTRARPPRRRAASPAPPRPASPG